MNLFPLDSRRGRHPWNRETLHFVSKDASGRVKADTEHSPQPTHCPEGSPHINSLHCHNNKTRTPAFSWSPHCPPLRHHLLPLCSLSSSLRPPFHSSRTPTSCLPPGLCTGCAPCWESSLSLRLHVASSPSSFPRLLDCHLL